MMKAAELKAWRAAHGISQRRLAAQLGVTFRIVQYWESGEVTPPYMLHLALERLGQIIAEHDGDVAAVAREQLAREVLGYA